MFYSSQLFFLCPINMYMFGSKAFLSPCSSKSCCLGCSSVCERLRIRKEREISANKETVIAPRSHFTKKVKRELDEEQGKSLFLLQKWILFVMYYFGFIYWNIDRTSLGLTPQANTKARNHQEHHFFKNPVWF